MEERLEDLAADCSGRGCRRRGLRASGAVGRIQFQARLPDRVVVDVSISDARSSVGRVAGLQHRPVGSSMGGASGVAGADDVRHFGAGLEWLPFYWRAGPAMAVLD